MFYTMLSCKACASMISDFANPLAHCKKLAGHYILAHCAAGPFKLMRENASLKFLTRSSCPNYVELLFRARRFLGPILQQLGPLCPCTPCQMYTFNKYISTSIYGSLIMSPPPSFFVPFPPFP